MWRRYFTFTYREIYGYLTIMIFMVLMVVAVKCGNVFDRGSEIVILDTDSTLIDTDLATLDSIHINTATVSQLKDFGFRNFAIVNIMRFRDMGGQFTCLTDLRDIYGIDTLLIDVKQNFILYDDVVVADTRRRYSRYSRTRYSSDNEKYNKRNYSSNKKTYSKRISLYHVLPDSLSLWGISADIIDSLLQYRDRFIIKGSVRLDSLAMCSVGNIGDFLQPYLVKPRKKREVRQKSEAKLEINSATVEQIEALKYVGDNTAWAIYLYREQLGGFYDLEQLHDLGNEYISSHFDVITRQLTIDATRVRRLNLNSRSDHKKLAKHPYVKNSSTFLNRVSRKCGNINQDYYNEKLSGLKNVDPRIEHYIKFE